eukprot:m.160580 g.160580  ORF g.160580 m.160580 type:complete len:395 (+) comp31187_c0_seq1:116-1300(+)
MLRDLSDRDGILADLAADGEHMTPEIIERYKLAARICNAAVAEVAKACVAGAVVYDLCKAGDEAVEEKLALAFNQGQIEKGPAFPTCVSLNNCCGNFSPLENDTTALKGGDMVKISLGVQIDGYISYGGHTLVVAKDGDDVSVPVTGRAADVLSAARDAAIIVHSLLRPDVTSDTLTAAIESVAKAYNCNPLHETVCYSMKRFVPQGRKQFLNRRPVNLQEESESFKIVDGEVYDVQISMSTGEGFHRPGDAKTTVLQRNLAANFQLRGKAGRAVYSDISNRFPTMPFSLRQLTSVKQLLGVKECINHFLLTEFEPTFEKPKHLVAQFRFTAMVHNGKTICLSDHEIQPTASEFRFEDERAQPVLAMAKNKPLGVLKWSTNILKPAPLPVPMEE